MSNAAEVRTVSDVAEVVCTDLAEVVCTDLAEVVCVD